MLAAARVLLEKFDAMQIPVLAALRKEPHFPS
jgi:hypothetical protein